MIYIRNSELTREQTDAAILIERIEGINIFNTATLVRRNAHEFGKYKVLPFLGRRGVVETVEYFRQTDVPNTWLNEDAAGSVALTRFLQPIEGCPEGVYATSQYVITEHIDGNGVTNVSVDPFTLALWGSHQQFMVFADMRSNIHEYGHDAAYEVATEVLNSFTELIPVPKVDTPVTS